MMTEGDRSDTVPGDTSVRIPSYRMRRGGGRTDPSDTRTVDRRAAPLVLAVTLMVAVLVATTLSTTDSWGDPSGYEWIGSGTEDDPWVLWVSGEKTELRAVLSGGTLTVYQDAGWTGGLSDIPDCPDASTLPWADESVKSQIKRIVIMDGIRSIGSYAFYGMSQMREGTVSGVVDLGQSDVVSIKAYAFGGGSEWMDLYSSDYACSSAEYAFSYLRDGNPMVNDLFDDSMMVTYYITSRLAGSTFSGGCGTLYYAGDTSEKHTTVYDIGTVDDGSGPAPTQDPVRSGKKITLPGYGGSRDGIPFSGWKCTNDGITYKPGQKVAMVEGGLTFQALFEEQLTHNVTFNANGGDWSEPLVVECDHGQELDLGTVTPPTRDSYTFEGWRCGTVQYGPSDRFQVETDMDLEAVWTENRVIIEYCTVNFDPDNGGSIRSTSVPRGSMWAIDDWIPTNPGFTFVGWELIGDATQPVDGYHAGDGFVVDDVLDFRAIWEQTLSPYCYIEYVLSGGTGDCPEMQVVKRGEGFTLPGCTATKSGYAFGGWKAATERYPGTYSAGEKLVADVTYVIFYADWVEDAVPAPILPDRTDERIEVPLDEGSEPWLGKNGRTVLIAAAVVAIIAELAVLAVSGRR